MDLPGSYSLVANSDEEVVTRDYIEHGNADLVCVLVDASQLERSMFMLADYTGIKVPAVLILNLMDVAQGQGKQINCEAISRDIGIPVLPFVASDKKGYTAFYELLLRQDKNSWLPDESGLASNMKNKLGTVYDQMMELLPREGVLVYSSNWILMKLIEKDQVVSEMVYSSIDRDKAGKLLELCGSVDNGSLQTGDSKYKWIDEILKGNVQGEKAIPQRSKFDKMATSKRWGKPFAILMVLVGLMLSMIAAMPIMGLGGLIRNLSLPLGQLLGKAGAAPLLISLLCDGIITAVSFAVMMSGFVF